MKAVDVVGRDVETEERPDNLTIIRQSIDAAPPMHAWPEPEPLVVQLPPVPKFDPELLPALLRNFAMDAAERMQCPPDFTSVGAMMLLATVVGRACGVRPKECDDYTCVPNLWGAIVGPPSVMKTPALKQMLFPLTKLAEEARARYQAELRDFKFDTDVMAAQAEARKIAIKKAVQSKDQAKIELLRREEQDARAC